MKILTWKKIAHSWHVFFPCWMLLFMTRHFLLDLSPLFLVFDFGLYFTVMAIAQNYWKKEEPFLRMQRQIKQARRNFDNAVQWFLETKDGAHLEIIIERSITYKKTQPKRREDLISRRDMLRY